MAIEPGTDAAFMPGRVFVDNTVRKTLLGIPDHIGDRAIDRGAAVSFLQHGLNSDYAGYDTRTGLHLVVTGGPGFNGAEITAEITKADVYGWRGQYRKFGSLGAYPDTPGSAGVTVTFNDGVAADYMHQVITQMRGWLEPELQSGAVRTEITVLKWFRRHPNVEKNMVLAEAARARVLVLLPVFLEFMRGWRSATVVRAHKVIT